MSPVLKVLVEGQTEEAFVTRLLKPHLATRGLMVSPVLPPTGPGQFGRTIKFSKFEDLLSRHLQDRSRPWVTMMFDIHRLHPSWREAVGETSTRPIAFQLQAALHTHIPNERFLPYFSSHDFEALLFSDPEGLCQGLQADPRRKRDIESILRQANTPEDINHDSPPGRRLEDLFPSYRKAVQGPVLAERIGLETMRSRCPHFAGWLARLESL